MRACLGSVAACGHAAPSTPSVLHDNALLVRPRNGEIQLDLFLDYANNVELYPAWQEYLHTHRPPVLLTWGKNDPCFLPAGAEAFKRDVPAAQVRFFDTGHFALETHLVEIVAAIHPFLADALNPHRAQSATRNA